MKYALYSFAPYATVKFKMYLAELTEEWTADTSIALLFDSMEEAERIKVLVRADDVEEVEDEAEFRAREPL